MEDEMTDSLAIYNQFDQLERAATALQKSGYFKDVTSQAQAIVKVMAGAELGLPPFASMSGINIIQGKPVLGANVLATLTKNDPRYDYKVKISTNLVCTLTWLENSKVVGESSFTIEEAKTAGLAEKDNWRKYPSDMLFARAISRGARRYAPGIFGGSPVYTPDEMGIDTDEDGHVVVDAVATEPEPQEPPQDPLWPATDEMTIEVANAFGRLTSTKQKYGDQDNERLGYMRKAVSKSLEAAETQEEQDKYQNKLNDIEIILDWRKQHSGA
jgi:hypothetical protein